MWWRRGALCLFGKELEAFQQFFPRRADSNRMHATTPLSVESNFS